MRLALQHVRAQADLVEKLDHALLTLGSAHRSVDGQRFPDDVGDALSGIERGVRILEDDLHAFAMTAQRRPAERGDVLSVDDNRPARWVDETEDQPRQCGFARAGLAHQAQRRSRGRRS